jgi:hypothetical protein
MPRTFFGFLPRRVPRTAPPIRPAAPVAIPATTAAFELPPFCFCDEDEDERLDEPFALLALDLFALDLFALALDLLALDLLAPALFALVLERGLLAEALVLFEAVERPLALEPFEL